MTNHCSSNKRPLHHKKLIPLASLIFIVTISGCTGPRSCLKGFCSSIEASKGAYTTERQARRVGREVWDCHHAQCYLNNCHYKEVREGFIDGFVSVCSGGSSCPPMFAPAKHSLCGLNKRCSTAWHEGWPLGAVAAESSGFCSSCCTRAHPCLRGPKVPCNPGCISCDSAGTGEPAGIEYHGEYTVESYDQPDVITETIQLEAGPGAHTYDAPIRVDQDIDDPTIVPPEPPRVPDIETPAEVAPPPAPGSVRIEQSSDVQISLATEPDLPVQVRRTTKSIAGIQDTRKRIATLIERFQQGAAGEEPFLNSRFVK